MSGLTSELPKPEPLEQETTQQQKTEHAMKPAEGDTNKQSERSRSASRRERRRRIQKALDEGKYMKTSNFEALVEADARGELQGMRPFERIGPDSTSMDGPVTYARAMRGEIPMRGAISNQAYRIDSQENTKGTLEDQDGLRLRLEANLDVEIELKASIRGDLTLSLL
ncbi:hypothetical protein MPH_11563 [Macrophomina phaseolina MS6]|uniref:Uncharacterized protein n=1 Tax=Macrophomina phaseolina (strain MS6) TaxID=1126212 RepID=K2QN30_MACPH|nr:hypothetical protein MPH_11563 [Macrophomina phaseolina MS6]